MRSGLQDIVFVVGSFILIFLLAPLAYAQQSGSLDAVYERAGLDQQLGEEVPLDLVFMDESGHPVTLGSFLQDGKPLILTLAYHECPMLCSVLLEGFTEAIKELDWAPGQEFEVITLSFDPNESLEVVHRKKAHYLEMLGKPGAEEGWHFLTGTETSIHTLADAIGYRYAWIDEIEQFVHPAVITLLTPDGTVSRYIQGLNFIPRDIRLGLVEASEGEIGSPVDFAALYCLQYDPETNAYSADVSNLMKLGGVLTLLALGFMLFTFWRKEGSRVEAAS